MFNRKYSHNVLNNPIIVRQRICLGPNGGYYRGVGAYFSRQWARLPRRQRKSFLLSTILPFHEEEVRSHRPFCIDCTVHWCRNTLRPTQKHGRHFSGHIFKCVFLIENNSSWLKWNYLASSDMTRGSCAKFEFGSRQCKQRNFHCMLTSSNGNIFRVTGLLCGEFTGSRWIPRTKTSEAELWCFLWSASE